MADRKVRSLSIRTVPVRSHAQADALEIEALAKRRLADEYDAAQERGEVQAHGGDRVSKVRNPNLAPTVKEIGLSKRDIHEARAIRDAWRDSRMRLPVD